MKDIYNDGYKTEDIKCIIVDFIPENGKGGFPIMRQGIYVLCKDCKYWDKQPSGLQYRIGNCERGGWKGMVMTEDDFCSRGEKK